MRRIIFAKVNFHLSLAAIAAFGVIAGGVIAARTAMAYGGLMEVGEVTVVKDCILDTPEIAPENCAQSCPLCTGIWNTACAAHNEVIYRPAGGVGTFACPLKVEPWLGGGANPPRIGSFIFALAQYLGGPLIMPGLSP